MAKTQRKRRGPHNRRQPLEQKRSRIWIGAYWEPSSGCGGALDRPRYEVVRTQNNLVERPGDTITPGRLQELLASPTLDVFVVKLARPVEQLMASGD